jgi:hypothetical protein
MANLEQKILAEVKMRELLRENGLPEPDGVEYGHGCIRLFFDEPKVAVVVDIDDPAEDADRWGAGDPRNARELWEQDGEVYDAEADDDYDGGYEPNIWEADDGELN